MALQVIEDFRARGLNPPIRIRPGARFYGLLAGSAFLVLGGVSYAVASDTEMAWTGWLGLGFATLWPMMFVSLARARGRGLIELSERGLYIALYGVELAWADVGPAWSLSQKLPVAVLPMRQEQLVIVVHNAAKYRKDLGFFARLAFRSGKHLGPTRKSAVLDRIVGSVARIAGEEEAAELRRVIEESRRLGDEAGAAVLSLVGVFAGGQPKAVAEIINAKAATRSGGVGKA